MHGDSRPSSFARRDPVRCTGSHSENPRHPVDGSRRTPCTRPAGAGDGYKECGARPCPNSDRHLGRTTAARRPRTAGRRSEHATGFGQNGVEIAAVFEDRVGNADVDAAVREECVVLERRLVKFTRDVPFRSNISGNLVPGIEREQISRDDPLRPKTGPGQHIPSRSRALHEDHRVAHVETGECPPAPRFDRKPASRKTATGEYALNVASDNQRRASRWRSGQSAAYPICLRRPLRWPSNCSSQSLTR